MKLKDIIIGREYVHPKYPGTIYLGCATINNSGKIINKFLVIIDTKDGEDVGHKVIKRTGNMDDDFWSEFIKKI